MSERDFRLEDDLPGLMDAVREIMQADRSAQHSEPN